MIKRTLSCAVLGTSVAFAALVVASSAQAATNKTGWATTKVDKGAVPYCAVSRRIDETTITVGRTLSGQSSLALEMANAKLDPARVYRLSLKPGSADRIDIETKPINAKTFVLNLDQVVDLSASFSASPTLQLRYDDQSMALSLANWDGAGRDLKSCLTALSDKAKPVDSVAEVKDVVPTPPTFAPELPKKIARAPEKPAVDVTPILAERDRARADLARVQEELDILKALPPVDTAPLMAERDQARSELKRVQEELETLKASRGADARAQEKDKEAQQNQAMRLSTLEAENENLRASLRARDADDVAQKVAIDERAKLVQVHTAEKAALEDQIAKLTAEIGKSKADQTVLSQDKTLWATEKTALEDHVAKLVAEAAQLKAEKVALEKQVAAAGQANNTAQSQAMKEQAARLAELQMQLDKTKAENDMIGARLAELKDQPKGPDADALQRRLESLTAENVKLRGELAAATVPETEMRVSVAAEAPLRAQLRDMRTENESLRARTSELMKLLDRNQSGDETALIKASSKNWDLEQATRRLQESEREVQRLSLSLRDSKTQCDAEKKEIEYMLFDPKLAKEGQIALLNSLEDKIAALQSSKNVTARPGAVASTSPVAAVNEAGRVPETLVKAERLPAPAQVAAVSPASGAIGLTSLLKQAGIVMKDTLAPAPKNPFGAGQAWAWQTDTLAGLAVEQPGVKKAAFDGTVSRQIKSLKSLCKGDFAAQPATPAVDARGIHYAAYDAACIAGANSTSAALLFYQQDGRFNVIAHETAPDDMAQAMEARDRLITTLVGP